MSDSQNFMHTGACLIALTYKRKLLLKRREDAGSLVNKNTWSFIEIMYNDRASSEDTILDEVEKEIHIRLPSVTLLLSLFDTEVRKNFYHAELTDKNVNELIRREGQEVQFFTMREVEKLSLTLLSKKLLTQCREAIEASFS